MSDPSGTDDRPTTAPEVIAPDGVSVDSAGGQVAERDGGDIVTEPAKVMRIGSMIKQLLEEVRSSDLDEPSRERLAEVYERSIVEVSEALSPDLQEELRTLSLPFSDESTPSKAEIRVAKAQLVGWLEGLFHGIQASMVAQQFAMQQQQARGQVRQLTGGTPETPQDGTRPGTYL